MPARPTAIRIELSTVDTADRFRGRPGVEQTGPPEVCSRAPDWLAAWDQIWPWTL